MYQWLDNVEMHLYATVDPNTPRGSTVMNILQTGDFRAHLQYKYIQSK